MSEERSAKLKLKRKKCVTTARVGQEGEVRLQPSSVLSLRQDFTGSWFDEIELTPAQQIWKQVLSSVYPDLSSMGCGAVPGLPDVNLKMNKKEKEMFKTEVFKVGDMSFEWFPLPTALTMDNAKKPCAPDIEASQQTIEPILKPSSDALPQNVQQSKSTMLLTKQVKIPVCSKDYKSNTRDIPTPQNSSTKNVMPAMSQKSTIENATKPRTSVKCFSKNVKEPQICKGSSKVAKEPQTLQKGSTRLSKEQQTSQKSNVSLWATVTSLKSNKTIRDPKGTVEPEAEEKSSDVIMIDATKETSEISSGGNRVKESVEKSADATSSLDNCPICLMQFPKQFSQLDMDSHLAQCLSETTVDVVW
ncbi:Fanconi anemia core complex-associated protein 20 [Eleutherodactylus coqui]|uniref:Fanconi anemia core complex-associated protein 20 n=1 Tax=Eleutherodactylus coqui TaxID=57060 RepID=UPI0034623EE6